MAMLFITHDLGIVRKLADTVCVMKEGKIVEHGPVERVFTAPHHPYTRALLAAEPKPDPAPACPDAPVVIETKDLKVWFPIKRGVMRRAVGHIKAVDGVSIAVRQGETLGVVGESGSGKTTLGLAILRLISSDGPVGGPRLGAPPPIPIPMPPPTGGPPGARGAPAPRGVAVLSSTEMTSETCRPFCPCPIRTLSEAPGLTAAWPAAFNVLACRNASPDPSDSATKPKPFSGLNHLTVASCSGPNPAEDGHDWTGRGISPGGARSKAKSSSKPRRLGGRPRPRLFIFKRPSSS